jgi:CHASE2 domain-containing sensor protein
MLTRLRLAFIHWSAAFARRFQNNFYLFLAGLLTIGILLDAGVFHVGENMRQKAFDFMVRHRVVIPRPDPGIVIVDVNEASLSALAPDFGRWPWPRQVFGEFVQQLEAQHPKAIVFDILFADADIYNPDSDTYFNEVIASTDNVFFPFLRLAGEHDGLSQVKPAMIPGIAAMEGTANPDATIAVVLPHFEAALRPGKLGTHNIYPDPDGIVREYRLWQDKDGWRSPSLPLAVGNFLQPEPIFPPRDMLINWRGGPFTYKTISFSDVYRDMTARTPQRPRDEFAGKIVIIGSTAPSLFDLKATAMAKTHPGVEILATAIDNVKHSDYLRFWRGALPYVLMSLLVIWLTAAAFYRNADRDRFNKIFSGSQIGLLGISYLGINLTDTYLDLTGPVTWAIVYFSIAKVYAIATDRAMQRWLAYGVEPGAGGLRAILMPILIESAEPLGDVMLKKLRFEVENMGTSPMNVEIMKGTQGGIWGLFGDMLLVRWTFPADMVDQEADIRRDSAEIAEKLSGVVSRSGLPAGTGFRHALHEGTLAGDLALAPQWRTMFAQAVLKLEHPQVNKEAK